MNPLLATDIYKVGHMLQYKPGTTKVYSNLCARSDRYFDHLVFFGLQYYLKEYLARPLIPEYAEEFVSAVESVLGECHPEIRQKVEALCALGYWPLEIKALPEGSVVKSKNALLTITNTKPEFYWCVGFVESLLLKVWYPTTVATNSLQYRQVVDKFFDATGEGLRDFAVHDFGYRSDSSEESAAISGAAHLLNFRGSDTLPALPWIDKYYGLQNERPMLSVPATEHSVMCSYGPEGEFEAFERMLDLYPNGIVSIVSDTYSIWDVCTKILPRLKDRILNRNGKVVIRPDSGNPPDIICGRFINHGPPSTSEELLGVLRLLDREFGSTVNSQGYRELNPRIGLIYGDGMYLDRYKDTLLRMRDLGYAANNLVIGCGGILRQGTRDTLGMAIKATYVEVNGVPQDIYKSPVTDPGKKSHRGLLQVMRDPTDDEILTLDQVSPRQEATGLLWTVFLDGEVTGETTWAGVRSNLQRSLR